MSAFRYGETDDPLARSAKPHRHVVQYEDPDAMQTKEIVVDPSGHDSDVGADHGPRKRIRLENASGIVEGEDVGLELTRKIFQTLGLPETTALVDLFPNIKYVISDSLSALPPKYKTASL